MTPRPSLPRFLIALILAPALIGGIGVLMMVSQIPGLDGIGAVLAVSMLCGAPAYFLAGGPLAWKAVKQGPPSRRDAVVWGLLANFASLLLVPLLLWAYFQATGPLQMEPELAKRWMETAPEMLETRWQPIVAGIVVFLLGIVFAPLYALAAHGLGRLFGVNAPAAPA